MTNEELDKLAAEVVMGFTRDGCYWRDGDSRRIAPCDPCSYWARSGQIIDRMRELGWKYSLGNEGMPQGKVRACFRNCGREGWEISDTPQRAVTIAAIRAMGREVPND